jgi:uncharacterized integral membrane protein
VAIRMVAGLSSRGQLMYFSLTVTFLLLLGLVIISLQNSMPLELKFITWNLQMPLTALILYSSLIGGAIVAVLALPKLVRKSLDVRSLNREIQKLKKKIAELGKGHVGGSQIA